MANLKLSHVYKVYDNGHKAVNDFNIDIKDKEFIVFVGPSGCGKSTTLRMVAGLEQITAGDLFIDDTLVNDMEPKDRDIAMVFQNYALYPHMTVYENMAFGLRNRHMPEDQIKEKVMEAAKILDIEDYLTRKPKEMSGGQRQRVALGRAIVRDPKVFLLDEPLSNLDAKLRAQMRTEISKLHKKLATTFIYVTHDQVEAMTMGTRIVVMKLGYVQQIDTPMNLYNKPYNKFVAGFIGTPQMNFFDVTLEREGDKVRMTFIDGQSVMLPYEKVSKIHDSYIHGGVTVTLGIRPDHISISKEETGLKAVVSAVERLGNESNIYADLGVSQDEFTMKDKGKSVIIKTIEELNVNNGDVVNLQINENRIHFFDHDTEITLMSPIPDYSLFGAKISGDEMELLGQKVKAPEIYKKSVGGDSEFQVEIPPRAIVPGEDFKLKVHEVEEIEGEHLAYLQFGDRYLFAIVDESVKAGSEYHFSFKNEMIRLKNADGVILEPVQEDESLLGTFYKEERKENHERVLYFFYKINGVSFAAPQQNGYKINAVDGNDCYKKTYRYSINRNNIVLGEGELEGKVTEVLDYGNVKYARLSIGDQSIMVNVPSEFNEENVKLTFKGEDVAVYQIEIDMRIC